MGPTSSGRASSTNYPPLRKPTPVGSRGEPLRSQTIASPMQYPTPHSGSGVDPIHQGGVSTHFGREAAAPASAGPQATAREHEISRRPDCPGVVPSYLQSQKRVDQEVNITYWPHTPTPATNTSPISAGGKGNQQRDGNRAHAQQNKPRPGQVKDNPSREEEEEDFAQIEDFIVNALHDDSFLELVKRIGGVWQKMGFDSTVPRMFTDMPDKEGA